MVTTQVKVSASRSAWFNATGRGVLSVIAILRQPEKDTRSRYGSFQEAVLLRVFFVRLPASRRREGSVHFGLIS
jgi:hypothetical protein